MRFRRPKGARIKYTRRRFQSTTIIFVIELRSDDTRTILTTYRIAMSTSYGIIFGKSKSRFSIFRLQWPTARILARGGHAFPRGITRDGGWRHWI